jgi:hypothetical protein
VSAEAELVTAVRESLAFADYVAIPALHKTDMFVMVERTPAHYRYRVDHPDEFESEAKDLGRALHALVLEPQAFSERYIVEPATGPGGERWDRRTTAHKAAWAEFQATAVGKEVLKQDDYAALIGMAQSIAGHTLATELLANTRRELTLLWPDAAGTARPMQLKARLDAYHNSGIIVDLKTARDASPYRFGADAYKYGYGFQAAMYLDGAQACGLKCDQFLLIAVESTPPYCSAVYEVTPAWIDIGREQYKSVLQQIAKWTTERRWPGYSEHVMDLLLPPWAGTELMGRID